MHIVYNNTKIHYYIETKNSLKNNAKNTLKKDECDPKNTDFIVFLHGWGAGSEVMKPLARMYAMRSHLPAKNAVFKAEDLTAPAPNKSAISKREWKKLKREKTHYIEKSEFADALRFSGAGFDDEARNTREVRFLFIDFPPFGGSGEPSEIWGVEDYAGAVLAVLRAEKAEKIKIIAHSFGGRVAILLAGVYNIVDEMVLIGGAGLRTRKSPLVRLRIASYKIARRLGLEVRRAGSVEYQALSPVMRGTFVRVVNRDLAREAGFVRCPVRLIYGLKDSATPPYLARRLHSRLPRSVLFFVKAADHYTWLI